MPASDSLSIIEGLTSIQSRFDPKETMNRLVAEINATGMIVFARIDHAAGAAEVVFGDTGAELVGREVVRASQ